MNNLILENTKGIYIHIPFCKYICTYCDFNKFYIQHQPVDKYIECLIKEIELTNINNVSTIYIGGGTPSSLNDNQLIKLLGKINEVVDINKIIEFTFEANPEDLTPDRVEILKKYGVNRVSMGVQTLNNELLKAIGRGHKEQDVYNAIKNLKNIGINNINVDLMFALPNQTMSDLEYSIEKILSYGITHISCYSLILEQRTKLYNQVKSNHIILPTNEVEEQMYDYVIKTLKKNGFIHYEISNFSLEGYESVHNSNYWHNLEYYGFGAGAHGYIDGYRYSNYAALKFYINNVENNNNAKRKETKLSNQEKIEESFFLGLRLLKGINISKIDNIYHISTQDMYGEVINKNIENGYLKLENNVLSLTPKGLFYGNDIFADFII